MSLYHLLPSSTIIRSSLSEYYRLDEQKLVATLLEQSGSEEQSNAINVLTKTLIAKVRQARKKAVG